MDISTVLVIGSGISGVSAAKLVEKHNGRVILFDQGEKASKEEIASKCGELQHTDIYVGNLPDELLCEVTLAVPSPGVPLDTPFMLEIKRRKIEIIGEIELAYRYEKGTLIAITGTNGKTTTTTLVGEMMKDAGKETFVVGNIGFPYTVDVEKTSRDSVTVAEISSFQLETICEFKPKVSAILNITPDHLNRHHTMDEYIRVKENISLNQDESCYVILNDDCEETKEFAKVTKARPVLFSTSQKLSNGYYLDHENIMYGFDGKNELIMNIHDMNLVGMCNIQNVMAAIAVGRCMNIDLATLLATIRSFHAVEHRIEFVATKNGVDYYNDSKGTNPDAAIQGIKAMSKPTVLIGGGYDKGSTYDEWIEAFEGKVKCLILIGQTRETIAECARKHGIENIILADTYDECLKLCVANATAGDAVLLSPACASWGMFPNYEVRGKMFKDFVNKL